MFFLINDIITCINEYAEENISVGNVTLFILLYSKTCLKRLPKIGFQEQLLLNTGKKNAECSKAFCNTFDLH